MDLFVKCHLKLHIDTDIDIDGLMPGYFTRDLLTHRAVNPQCINERPTSTGMNDTDASS